jgi:hypothetical protein
VNRYADSDKSTDDLRLAGDAASASDRLAPPHGELRCLRSKVARTGAHRWKQKLIAGIHQTQVGKEVKPTRKSIMKKFAVALLATAALSLPAVAQQPAQSTNQAQPQISGQMAQNNGGQPLSPNKLSRDKVRQVQRALDKSGFHAGTADGRWGPETSNALKQFQQSKNIQAKGQLDQQTISGLGLNGAQFAQQNKRNGGQQH